MNFKTKWGKSILIAITALLGLAIGQRMSPLTLVYGDSMEPTLHSGEVLPINHAVPAQLARGTIVLVSMPGHMPLIKRIVGLPNEMISFRLGEVFIDGHMLIEPYVPPESTTFSWNRDYLMTGEDEYVVLGDNRLTSQDSRDYGVISRNEIIATVDLASTPARLLEHPQFRISKSATRAARSVR